MIEARELLGPASGARDANRKRMLVEIMVKADRQSRIAYRSGLSQASVSTAVQELVAEQVLEIDRTQDKVRGRTTPVRLAPTRGVAIGVDISHDHVVVVARRVDQRHDKFSVQQRGDGANRGLSRLLPMIKSMIGEAVEETGQTLDDVVAAGLSVPRMIDPRTGRFTTPVLLPWHDYDRPAEDLTEHLGVRVAIDNDANLGAMAEQIYGMDEPAETVVYVKATNGVGVGIMIGDKLYRGHRGMAGEIGHLTIDRNGDVCECGGRGCLDTIVGSESLVAEVRRSHRGSTTDNPVTLQSLIEKAHARDAVCTRVLQDAGRTLGIALAQLCNLLNPRLIVLGGELATGKDLLLGPCMQELRRYALGGAVNDREGFTLRLSQLSPYSEAQGALILGLRARKVEEFVAD
ncbi:ROK family protein [Lentzea jiangxiensis]|uniref:Sugar kinase of the NBD/HSP70 family, may contain an N-terminal HTH domain n=1 Tax=Lentzea jiangxiensis TaxID=641025 RepID=A0A1H0SF37_9PSEU|nr:ROK family protein [Lentzea jiangxiensis]SDP40344.1 Sugar kinase of the NBD/HSP70 family, may contain an N-terminal HTH domain [Lentzea jiangxiensis]